VFFPLLVLMRFRLQLKQKTPKGMPIGILGSLVICTILYVLFAHVMGLVPYSCFANDAKPAATAFAVTGYDFSSSKVNLAIWRDTLQ
jgi:amino acid transporter